MAEAVAAARPGMKWHTRGAWSTREDRLPSLVWVALIWFGMIAGFGVDMPRFLHETPPPAKVVYVHAFVYTVWLLILTAQVLLVVKDRVALHRRLGWFAAGWAGLMVVLGLWVAMVAKGPVAAGPGSPQFLAMNFGAIAAFAALLLWGIALRGNPAAHKRVMILATIAILDPGYARLSQWLIHEPPSIAWWFVWNFYGNLLIIGLMAAWDLWNGRLMKQFVVGAAALLALEGLQDFLYHWEPWKAFAVGLLASWARHFG